MIYKKKIIIILIFSLFLKSEIFSEDYNSAIYNLERAKEQILLKNYIAAVQLLEKAESDFPKDGYFATWIGTIYSWHLKQFDKSLPHFERALRQGGQQKPWTLREYGYALMMSEDFDTAEEFILQSVSLADSNKDELIQSYGFLSQLYKKTRRFQDSIDTALKAYNLNENSDNFYICDSIVKSNLHLAYMNVSSQNYSASIKNFYEAEKYQSRNKLVSIYSKNYELNVQREIIENRKKLGNINPIYINKSLGLFISETNVVFSSLNGSLIKSKSFVTQEEIESAKLYQKVLKEFIESLSDGNYSISYENIEVNSTLKEIKVSIYGGVETREPVIEGITPSISDIFYKNRNKYDTFIIYWNGKNIFTTANGGGILYPFINYQMYSDNRGYISFPTNWTDEFQIKGLLHEFFHNIEALTGISPTHGFNNKGSFPSWRGDGELDYYRWHFKTTLPKVIGDKNLNEGQADWKNLSWLNRFKDIYKEADYSHIRDLVKSISEENLKKAHTLSNKAKNLFLDKSDLNEIDMLYKEAYTLNPYNPLSLRYMAEYYNRNQKYKEAVKFYTNLSQVQPEAWVFRSLSYIQQWKLKDFKSAFQTFKIYFDRYPDEKNLQCIEYGRLLIDLQLYDDALQSFELCVNSKDKSKSPTTKAQANFWKGYVLGEKKGDSKSASKYIKIGYEEGFRDEFTLYHYNKYNK